MVLWKLIDGYNTDDFQLDIVGWLWYRAYNDIAADHLHRFPCNPWRRLSRTHRPDRNPQPAYLPTTLDTSTTNFP